MLENPSIFCLLFGWGGKIWTYACGSQSPVPYRLATPHLVRPKGFEPPTLALEGRCSIQLSYKHIGAGDGNRTHAASLEGWNSTIELRPRTSNKCEFRIPQPPGLVNKIWQIFENNAINLQPHALCDTILLFTTANTTEIALSIYALRNRGRTISVVDQINIKSYSS